MIRFEHVTFTHHGAAAPTLCDVSLELLDGELVVVAGRTGAGKSTLLAACNGLVPQFTGGTLTGSVTVDGVSTASRPPREFAQHVGYVGQDPLAGFVSDTVEAELAYGLEQLGVDPQTMRRRVEETLDLLGIAELRDRDLRSLSGGQQQRVAIGAVLTMHPTVLVLDEPTSALDPTAAEDVLATLHRLVHDLGTTVLIAEHRLERVLPFADRMAYVRGDGSVALGAPHEVLAELDAAPPIIELGRAAGWSPLPLTVRDARRALRGDERLGHLQQGSAPARDEAVDGRDFDARGDDVLKARRLVVRHGTVTALRDVDVRIGAGEVVALMGRNGAGKSSLLWALHGAGEVTSGEVVRSSEVALVPQTASDLLLASTVDRECADADARTRAAPGSCRSLLDRIVPGVDGALDPRDISAGQQLALVLAMQLTAEPAIVLLDEPTRGLDYDGKRALAEFLTGIARAGTAVVVATHDVEFAARIAGRVVVLADGDVVADGEATEVLCGSPAFAPQVAKVLGEGWLTVEQVRAALADGVHA